ncbi:RDD family protein [Rubritalea spongiae]|uniref:RDD family protein n=1 Tax=Rubritalea spongiae TaxID=430797 RepID=A0ABW5DZH7_9BACT
MNVWLIENGEKGGPFESYAVRERIESGEISADTLAWYQGAEGWVRIDTIPQFSILFAEKEDATPPPMPEEVQKSPREELKEAIAREVAKAPPLHMTRRFFARIFDYLLYISLIFVCFQERAFDALMGESMMQFLGVGIAYVILDGLMTHLWKSSPGKFLLGLKVTDHLGLAIPLKGSVIRSLRAWILGLGMWVMMPFAIAISWFMAKRFGYFLWDMPHRYRVLARPFSALHVVAYIVSVLIVNVVFSSLISQEVMEEMYKTLGVEDWMKQ